MLQKIFALWKSSSNTDRSKNHVSVAPLKPLPEPKGPETIISEIGRRRPMKGRFNEQCVRVRFSKLGASPTIS